MDSVTLFYPPEDAHKISVTGTKEEWQQLRSELFDNMIYTLTEDTAAWKILGVLFDQGVCQ